MEENLYEKTSTFWNFCAEKPPKEFCKADSGSPLICEVDGKVRLYGIISDSVFGN